MPEYRCSKLAAIAGLAARVKAETDDGLAKRMGTPKPGGEKAAVSELRMRRLLACDDLEELYTLLRRALALLDDRTNLADLAVVVWHWTPMDEEQQVWLKNRQANNFKQKNPTKKRVRHDVVMDAKLKMDWTNLPKDNRPTLSQVAYDVGSRWLLGRSEKLGCEFDVSTLRVDGHDTWASASRKEN